MTLSDETAPEPGVRRAWPYALILFALAVGVYASALSGPFVFDDDSGVVRNANLRSLTPLSQSLSAPPYTGANGRPFVALTLALNYAAGELAVEGYRVFNVALHGLCALALFGVLRRGLRAARSPAPATAVAFATALLWAVHPLCTDAVNLVITRNEQLMALFYLGTLYAALRGFEGSRAWLVAAVASCLLGMASKENMVSAPVAVLVLDRALSGATWRATLRRRAPCYAALAATWILLGFLVAGQERGQTVGLDRGMSVRDYFLTQAEVVPHYLRLCVWPSPLLMDYGDASVYEGPKSWLPWGATYVLAAAGVAWLVLRRAPGAVAAFVFLAVLAPTSSVIPVTGEVAAEHRMYLPLSCVLFVLVGAAWRAGAATLPAAGARRALGAALVLALAIPCAVATRARNAQYATADGIWRDTIAKQPQNARGYCGLARELIRQDRLNEAVEQLERSLRIRPYYAESHRMLGALFARTGREAEADEHYQAAARFDRGLPRYVFSAGESALDAGDAAFAIECFTDVLRMKPDFARAKLELGWIRAAWPQARQRDAREARRLARELVDAEPAPRHLDLLAAALARSGRFEEAAAAATRALEGVAGSGPDGTRLGAAIRRRRELYLRGQPFEGRP